MLITAGDNAERLTGEASFAALRPIVGAEKVVRFIVGGSGKTEGTLSVHPQQGPSDHPRQHDTTPPADIFVSR